MYDKILPIGLFAILCGALGLTFFSTSPKPINEQNKEVIEEYNQENKVTPQKLHKNNYFILNG